MAALLGCGRVAGHGVGELWVSVRDYAGAGGGFGGVGVGGGVGW